MKNRSKKVTIITLLITLGHQCQSLKAALPRKPDPSQMAKERIKQQELADLALREKEAFMTSLTPQKVQSITTKFQQQMDTIVQKTHKENTLDTLHTLATNLIAKIQQLIQDADNYKNTQASSLTQAESKKVQAGIDTFSALRQDIIKLYQTYCEDIFESDLENITLDDSLPSDQKRKAIAQITVEWLKNIQEMRHDLQKQLAPTLPPFETQNIQQQLSSLKALEQYVNDTRDKNQAIIEQQEKKQKPMPVEVASEVDLGKALTDYNRSLQQAMQGERASGPEDIVELDLLDPITIAQTDLKLSQETDPDKVASMLASIQSMRDGTDTLSQQFEQNERKPDASRMRRQKQALEDIIDRLQETQRVLEERLATPLPSPARSPMPHPGQRLPQALRKRLQWTHSDTLNRYIKALPAALTSLDLTALITPDAAAILYLERSKGGQAPMDASKIIAELDIDNMNPATLQATRSNIESLMSQTRQLINHKNFQDVQDEISETLEEQLRKLQKIVNALSEQATITSEQRSGERFVGNLPSTRE